MPEMWGFRRIRRFVSIQDSVAFADNGRWGQEGCQGEERKKEEVRRKRSALGGARHDVGEVRGCVFCLTEEAKI